MFGGVWEHFGEVWGRFGKIDFFEFCITLADAPAAGRGQMATDFPIGFLKETSLKNMIFSEWS